MLGTTEKAKTIGGDELYQKRARQALPPRSRVASIARCAGSCEYSSVKACEYFTRAS
jgi:hypothetical protein